MTEKTPWKVIRTSVMKGSSVYSATINCAIAKDELTPQLKKSIEDTAKTDGITHVSVELFKKKTEDEAAILMYGATKDALGVAVQALVSAAFIEKTALEKIEAKMETAA
jgi:hypothetical protein